MSEKYEVLRIWAEALYDHQDVRMASANRVRGLIRRKLLELGFLKEEKKTDDDGEDGELKSKEEPSWKDEELETAMQEAEEQGMLSEADHSFLYKSLALAKKENKIEQEYEANLKPLIQQEPIWEQWLADVKGISTRNACRLLRYFGYCERFDTISKLWAYAGLAVTPEGKAVKRQKGEKLPYNLKIKTGVVGVIGDSLIKASGAYKRHDYDAYKQRIQERGCCQDVRKKDGKPCRDFPGHAHRMAIRHMVKVFLADYWKLTREIKGLPCRPQYAIDKLPDHTTEHKPHIDKPITPLEIPTKK